MTALVTAFILLAATPVWAQQMTLPTTGTWTNTKGEVIGTVTNAGGRLYMRDLKGEHVATIVFEKDGTRTIYDPSGKVLDQIKAEKK